MALLYYVPAKLEVLGYDYKELMDEWVSIVIAISFFLGVISVFQVHAYKIRRSAPGWGYSVVVFFGIFLILVPGIIFKGKIDIDGTETWFGWMYRYILNPLQATMFALLGFYVASAAFRAFRAKSFDSSVLLFFAIVVIFGAVPLGAYLFELVVPQSWTAEVNIPDIVEWIKNFPNMAARRGIILGATLGAIAVCLKIIFGIERSYLGGGKE